MRPKALLFCTILFLVSCYEEESYDFHTAVEMAFWKYFDSFSEEAFKRDRKIDWNSELIYARLTTIETNAVGQCLTFDNGRNELFIDHKYWQSKTDLEKEYLIFHELGHCVLKRGHFNNAHADGSCESIMNSGQNVCKKNYTYKTRSAYLDELFH